MPSTLSSLKPWQAVLGALLCVVAFLLALTEMRDTDAFHHLALGRAIVRGGAVPSQDPFLYPLAGLEVGRMPYWLSAVIFYASQQLGGDGGPVVLAAAATAALLLVLWVDATADAKDLSGLLLALVSLLLALGVCRGRAVPRPEVFSNIFLALTALALRRFAVGHRRWLFAFPAVAVLWANLHPSVLSGAGLALIFAGVGLVGTLLPRPAGVPPPDRRGLLLAGALGIAGVFTAGLFSARGFDPLVTSVKFILSAAGLSDQPLQGPLGDPLPFLKHQVVELQPLSAALWAGPFGVLVGLTALSVILGWRRAAAWEVAASALLVALAARNERYVTLAALVMAPVAARNLVAFLARLAPGPSWRRLGLTGVAAAAALAVTARAATSDDLHFGTQLARKSFPVAAADYLAREAPDARLFNTFQLGGYLEWRLDRPVFQDGRAMLLAPDMEAAFADPINAALFKTLDDRYRFDALVLAYVTGIDQATAAALDATQGAQDWLADRRTWALVAFDDGGLLYLRKTGRFAALAARDEYRAARPGNPFSRANLLDTAQRAAFIADYQRALAQTPGCNKCRFHLGMALISDGQPAKAEALLAEALPRASGRYAGELRYGMGLAADLQGNPARARAHLEGALAEQPAAPNVRRALATLELDEGNAARAWALLEQNLTAQPAREDFALAASARRALGDPAGAEELSARVASAEARARAEQHYLEGLKTMQAGQLDAAATAFRASLELVEPSAPAHSNLGWVYFDQKQPDRALGEFRRAAEVDPTLPEPHFGLGLILSQRGDNPGASDAFRTFLRLQPRGPWAQQAEAHLRRLGP